MGLVLFLIGRGMEYLMMLSAGSSSILILSLPRLKTLEQVVMARVLACEAMQTAEKEYHGNA